MKFAGPRFPIKEWPGHTGHLEEDCCSVDCHGIDASGLGCKRPLRVNWYSHAKHPGSPVAGGPAHELCVSLDLDCLDHHIEDFFLPKTEKSGLGSLCSTPVGDRSSEWLEFYGSPQTEWLSGDAKHLETSSLEKVLHKRAPNSDEFKYFSREDLERHGLLPRESTTLPEPRVQTLVDFNACNCTIGVQTPAHCDEQASNQRTSKVHDKLVRLFTRRRNCELHRTAMLLWKISTKQAKRNSELEVLQAENLKLRAQMKRVVHFLSNRL